MVPAMNQDGGMSTKSGFGPDNPDTGSWATESLPLSVRKEMLERELRKLGFRRPEGGSPASSSQQQQQPQGSNSHPQADCDGGGEHSE